MGSCPDTDIDPGILQHFFKKYTLQISFQYIGPFKKDSKERERDKKWTCFSQTSNKLGL